MDQVLTRRGGERVGQSGLPRLFETLAQRGLAAVERAKLRPGQALFTYLHLAPDPEQARELLAAAGWKGKNADGLLVNQQGQPTASMPAAQLSMLRSAT